MRLQVPPPPGSGTDVKFEIVPEAGEGGQTSGDRATVYKRLQQELIQQTRVGVVGALGVHVYVNVVEKFRINVCLIICVLFAALHLLV